MPFLVALTGKGFLISAVRCTHRHVPQCRIREATVVRDLSSHSLHVHARSLRCSACHRYPRRDGDIRWKRIGCGLGSRTETGTDGEALVCPNIEDYSSLKPEKIRDTDLTIRLSFPRFSYFHLCFHWPSSHSHRLGPLFCISRAAHSHVRYPQTTVGLPLRPAGMNPYTGMQTALD